MAHSPRGTCLYQPKFHRQQPGGRLISTTVFTRRVPDPFNTVSASRPSSELVLCIKVLHYNDNVGNIRVPVHVKELLQNPALIHVGSAQRLPKTLSFSALPSNAWCVSSRRVGSAANTESSRRKENISFASFQPHRLVQGPRWGATDFFRRDPETWLRNKSKSHNMSQFSAL